MARARFKRLRFSKRWDDRGVASTVGTVMAIMVILALLSLVTNHYVPVWMKDSESSHMELALSQLSSFKTTMDNQMLFAEVLFYTNNEFTSTPVYTAVKLGSDGVPVFASPTQGELGIHPEKGNVSVEAVYTLNNTAYNIEEITTGNIELSVPNRYFVPQTLVYENGGIIRHQNDGEVMVAEPQFSAANKTGDGWHVTLTLVWLFGVGSASGSGTEGISSKLIGMDFQVYNNLSSSIYINHTTRYGIAWYNYYNNTLLNSYKPSSIVYSKIGSTTTVETSFYKITLTELSFGKYTVWVELKNTGNCLKKLKLNLAYVDIAIGRKRGETEL